MTETIRIRSYYWKICVHSSHVTVFRTLGASLFLNCLVSVLECFVLSHSLISVLPFSSAYLILPSIQVIVSVTFFLLLLGRILLLKSNVSWVVSYCFRNCFMPHPPPGCRSSAEKPFVILMGLFLSVTWLSFHILPLSFSFFNFSMTWWSCGMGLCACDSKCLLYLDGRLSLDVGNFPYYFVECISYVFNLHFSFFYVHNLLVWSFYSVP